MIIFKNTNRYYLGIILSVLYRVGFISLILSYFYTLIFLMHTKNLKHQYLYKVKFVFI